VVPGAQRRLGNSGASGIRFVGGQVQPVRGPDRVGGLRRAHSPHRGNLRGHLRPAGTRNPAWAWLPLGGQDVFPVQVASARPADGQTGIRFALGAVGSGVSGFRRTNQQALGAHAVALAAGPSGPFMTSFADVAPLALMSGSIELVRAWVAETLRSLADDDEYSSVLRDTLRVFLQEGGSFKATAERLTLHKNTVQYRVRKAEQSLGRPVCEDRLQIELALLASQWLGAAVLRHPARP
jgi:PucR C-terminal helix-turn-helix domain